MRKARVKVTNICNRSCDGCCNNDPMFHPKTIESIKEVIEYDEILLTGGDPALFPDELYLLVKYIRYNLKYKGKIFIYTSSVMNAYEYSFESPPLLEMIDGLQHTIHEQATDFDVSELKRLSEILKSYHSPTIKNRLSTRLAIDKRLYDKYDFSNIDFAGWSVIRKLVWKEHCPLPDGEELFYFDMVKNYKK